MASFKPPIWRLALPAVPLPPCAETALQLREPFAQFVELRPPFGKCDFHALHNVLRRATSECLVLQTRLLRSDVLGEAVEFLAQARNFNLYVERRYECCSNRGRHLRTRHGDTGA